MKFTIETEYLENYEDGFGHRAILVNSEGHYLWMKTIGYFNRTWESYQYQTVKKKLVGEAIIAYPEYRKELEKLYKTL